MRFPPALVAIPLLLLASCDPVPCCCCGPPRPAHGEFHATLAGAMDMSFAGKATFRDLSPGLEITLAGPSGAQIVFRRADGSLPSLTGYPLGADHAAATDVVGGYGWGPGAEWSATEGSLRIMSASADGVRGDFDFTARASDPVAEPLHVVGSFDAARAVPQ